VGCALGLNGGEVYLELFSKNVPSKSFKGDRGVNYLGLENEVRGR